MKPLVLLEHVGVELGGNRVLRDVDTQIRRGQVTALIGLNGSGKTTLLKTLLGELPHSGHVHFHPPRPTIGYVPQRLVVDARMPLTVRDLFGLALQRWPIFLGLRPATVEKTKTLLARVFRDPKPMLDRPVEKLSGGELQRVLLALALEPAPHLLLLDEPASGIDFQDQERFYDLIAQLNRDTGVAVVLVSHDLSVVTRHAHHVLCLTDGRIRCEGPPGEILSGEALAATFGDKSAFAHDHAH